MGNKRLGKALWADRRVDEAEEAWEAAGRNGRHKKCWTTTLQRAVHHGLHEVQAELSAQLVDMVD